jgi:hypothetical protein
MRIIFAEEMRTLGRNQPRRCAVAAVGVKKDEVARRRRVELVELIAAGEHRQVPFEQVDEDALSRGEHGAQRRIPGRAGRPRGHVDHGCSSAVWCRESDHFVAIARIPIKWG